MQLIFDFRMLSKNQTHIHTKITISIVLHLNTENRYFKLKDKRNTILRKIAKIT